MAVVAGAACALVLAAGPVPAAQAEEAVPTPETLSLALLEAVDVGPEFMPEEAPPDGEVPEEESAEPSGCPALDNLTEPPAPDPSTRWPEITLRADTVFVSEKLVAATPEVIAADHAVLRDALKTCTTLSFPADAGETVTFELSQINFGGPESVAVRMDGNYAGVPINGYLAFEPLGAVELMYMFFQVGDSSSQFASAVYALAVDKIHAVVGPAAGPPQPIVTPGSDTRV